MYLKFHGYFMSKAARVAAAFGVGHVTVEIEREDCADERGASPEPELADH